MERVGVLVHPVRPVQAALDVLREWTDRHGLELVQIPAGEQPSVAPEGEVSACDLVTALGGDGTVLKALHAAARTRTPVMGVAYGSLGALTAVPETELIGGLDRFAAGDWVARRLPALCLATSEGELAWALNDIVMTRRGGTQLVVDVSVGDELYVRVAGDGMIVATPLGSSAYSMAAGGPLLSVASEVFVCTPLAMHGGSAPPLVVPSDSEITLEAHPGHDGFDLNVDGFQVQSSVERFVVTAAPHYSTLVAMDGIVTGVTGLRERGLITDSPRVLVRDGRTVSTRAG
jgi:NAD+ kinase